MTDPLSRLRPAARAQIRALAASLPALDSIDELDALAWLLEERAIRAALVASGWLVQPAARALGRAGGSALQKALLRHPALASELAAVVARRRRVPVTRSAAA